MQSSTKQPEGTTGLCGYVCVSLNIAGSCLVGAAVSELEAAGDCF